MYITKQSCPDMVSSTTDPLSWFQCLFFLSGQDQASTFSSPSMRLLGKPSFSRSIVSIVQQPMGGTHVTLSISPFLPGCYSLPPSLPFGLFLFCSFCYCKQVLTEIFSAVKNEEIPLSDNYIKWPQITFLVVNPLLQEMSKEKMKLLSLKAACGIITIAQPQILSGTSIECFHL